jgi:hypothetical protein
MNYVFGINEKTVQVEDDGADGRETIRCAVSYPPLLHGSKSSSSHHRETGRHGIFVEIEGILPLFGRSHIAQC